MYSDWCRQGNVGHESYKTVVPFAQYCSGKAIALRLAKDGYDICINDVASNEQGVNEVSMPML